MRFLPCSRFLPEPGQCASWACSPPAHQVRAKEPRLLETREASRLVRWLPWKCQGKPASLSLCQGRPCPLTRIQPDTAPGVKSGRRAPAPQTPSQTRTRGNGGCRRGPEALPQPPCRVRQGGAPRPLSRLSPGNSQLFSRSQAPKDVFWAGLAVPTLLKTLNLHVGREQGEGQSSSRLRLISPNSARFRLTLGALSPGPTSAGSFHPPSAEMTFPIKMGNKSSEAHFFFLF